MAIAMQLAPKLKYRMAGPKMMVASGVKVGIHILTTKL
jgi:hypothetical protein